MTSIPDGLTADTNPSLGAFSDGQNRAILITGLACSCVSLVATLVTLRWFLAMKRLFRHRLVLYLIIADFFKAFWYFVFPIVVFSRGPVQSASPWCQAQGFLLAFAIEASDFAILLIALHAMLYIFKPQVRIGKGGLYKWRNWTPIVWLGPPAILASLAFINHGQGYVTAGTFCYLPKRPIWYRLALTYIPRYIILSTIFCMYAAISVYVHIKFRSFKDVVQTRGTGSQFSDIERSTSYTESIAPDEIGPRDEIAPTDEVGPTDEVPERPPSPPLPQLPPHSPPPQSPTLPAVAEKKHFNTRPGFARGFSYRSHKDAPAPQQHNEPWDAMNFITAKALHDYSMNQSGVQTADFAPPPVRGSASTDDTKVDSGTSSPRTHANDDLHKSRQASEVPTMNTSKTESTTSAPPQKRVRKRKSKELLVMDPLQRTRLAIRNQLRFLFIYPAVYALMWVFPFVQNCLLYSNHFASHPIFWLQVVSTCALSLQAAVDCVVFCWRETPWRRVQDDSKFSIPFWREQSVTLIKRVSFTGSAIFHPSRKGTTASEDIPPTEPAPPANAPSRMWWEEEGRKRKDSVWLGTDLLSKFTSKNTERASQEAQLDSIEERNGSV